MSGYHDFYVAYDPATHQDKFYGAGAAGYHIYDVSKPEEPKLVTSIVGAAGVDFGHTFTPTPDGRYAIAETEYQSGAAALLSSKFECDSWICWVQNDDLVERVVQIEHVFEGLAFCGSRPKSMDPIPIITTTTGVITRPLSATNGEGPLEAQQPARCREGIKVAGDIDAHVHRHVY